MSDPPLPDDAVAEPDDEDPAPGVEAYETEDGVVLYDAENPLAWLKGSEVVTLDERQ
jgi:hypothetical protein